MYGVNKNNKKIDAHFIYLHRLRVSLKEVLYCRVTSTDYIVQYSQL